MGANSSKKSGGYPKQDMSGYPTQQQLMAQGPPGGYPAAPPPQEYPPQQSYNPGPPHEGYPPQNGYPPQQGYPPHQGYPPEQGYPPQNGYPQQEGYPEQHGYPPHQGYPPNQGYPGQFDDRNIDNVDRHDSACQYQFQPGDETYRCIDCEITDDTPS